MFAPIGAKCRILYPLFHLPEMVICHLKDNKLLPESYRGSAGARSRLESDQREFSITSCLDLIISLSYKLISMVIEVSTVLKIEAVMEAYLVDMTRNCIGTLSRTRLKCQIFVLGDYSLIGITLLKSNLSLLYVLEYVTSLSTRCYLSTSLCVLDITQAFSPTILNTVSKPRLHNGKRVTTCQNNNGCSLLVSISLRLVILCNELLPICLLV